MCPLPFLYPDIDKAVGINPIANGDMFGEFGSTHDVTFIRAAALIGGHAGLAVAFLTLATFIPVFEGEALTVCIQTGVFQRLLQGA